MDTNKIAERVVVGSILRFEQSKYNFERSGGFITTEAYFIAQSLPANVLIDALKDFRKARDNLIGRLKGTEGIMNARPSGTIYVNSVSGKGISFICGIDFEMDHDADVDVVRSELAKLGLKEK